MTNSALKSKLAGIKAGIAKAIKNPSFTLKEQLGYASGSFGYQMGIDMINTFLLLFLTDYMGIKASVLIVFMAFAKGINIISNPIAGYILDRPTRDIKKGQARPFLLMSPFPMVVSSVLLFVVPNINYTSRIIYVFAFYLTYSLSETFYETALLTTSARMTNNPNDRKNFYTVAEFASTLGSMLPGAIIPVLISLYKENYMAQKNIYLFATIGFGIVGVVMMIIPYFNLREKTLEGWRKPNEVKLSFKALMLNRPLILMMLAQIVDSVRQVSFGAMIFFFAKTLNAFWMSTLIGTITGALSYVGIALVPIIGKKLSSRDIIVVSYAYTGVCYLLLLIFGYKSLLVVGILISLSGATSGMIRTLRKIILADSTDYMEYKTWKKYGVGVRSEGMVFAMSTMSGRISNLWKDLLLPTGLLIVGYASATVMPSGETIEAVQTPQALRGIFYLVTIPGVVGHLVPAFILLFDNYTGKRKEMILKELGEMREQKRQEYLASQQEEVCEAEA